MHARPSPLSTICLTAVLVLMGCDRPTPQASPKAVKPVDIADIDGAGFEKEIANHRGKVVFVDFWATWCEACAEFFPHTVDLHKQFSPQGFTSIAVSLDNAGYREDAGKFLAEHGASFPCFRSSLGATQKSAKQFGIKSGVPCFRLYGRDGRLIREWDTIPAEHDEVAKEIAAEIEKALAAEIPTS